MIIIIVVVFVYSSSTLSCSSATPAYGKSTSADPNGSITSSTRHERRSARSSSSLATSRAPNKGDTSDQEGGKQLSSPGHHHLQHEPRDKAAKKRGRRNQETNRLPSRNLTALEPNGGEGPGEGGSQSPLSTLHHTIYRRFVALQTTYQDLRYHMRRRCQDDREFRLELGSRPLPVTAPAYASAVTRSHGTLGRVTARAGP